MRTLKYLLYADLERQFELEGNPQLQVTFGRFMKRLFHHRFLPIVLCRCARAAMLVGLPLVPQLLTYANLLLFGLEIPAKCEIGPGLFLPHTTGTVVGAWRMGRNVTIYQGVTLGAKVADMGFDISMRPDVGSNVVFGAGCKVLGGITVGDNVTVGANSVLLESVPSGSVAVGIPARIILTK